MTDICERLRELLAKATPGPWAVDGPPHNQIVWSGPDDRVCFMTHSDGADVERDKATAALIVEAVNALPDLLATIESLRAELAEVLKESIALRCLLGGGCDANDDGPHETIVGKGRDKFCAKCGEMLDSKDRSKPWFHGGRLERAKARNERTTT